jgi:hypothetical protein
MNVYFSCQPFIIFYPEPNQFMVMFVETLEPMKIQSLFGMLLAVGLMTSCGETTTPNTDSEEMTNTDLSVIPEIPVEDFFKNPEMASFQISPDGKYYSYRAPWEDEHFRERSGQR